MDALEPTCISPNNDISVFLAHIAVILHLESLQALDELLVDSGIRRPRGSGAHDVRIVPDESYESRGAIQSRCRLELLKMEL